LHLQESWDVHFLNARLLTPTIGNSVEVLPRALPPMFARYRGDQNEELEMSVTNVAPTPLLCTLEAASMIKIPVGVTARVVAKSAQTNGAFGLIEAIYPPGQGFPMHVHHNEDEIQYIIEGKLLIVAGDQRLIAGPGDFFYGPRNIAHGFRSVGDTPARFLEGYLPGGFEGMFTTPLEMLAGVISGSIGRQYNIEIVGLIPD
jgi:mannose-6-phosphate isomerase-like protein (cupin superfamily)